MYRLQSIEGYDPLYLRRYGELIAASERSQPNINPPFGFNRIITPHNFDSKIIDLLGVKYVLSLTDISSAKLKKVFQEGQTQVYENKDVLPRSFFVEKIILSKNKNDSIKSLFENKDSLSRVAIVEGLKSFEPSIYVGSSQIISYEENKVIIQTDNQGEGFLVLTDTFYPTWKARVDGKKTQIYLADFNFRGIIVPRGKHSIEFSDKIF
jgi:uncharacterized membrane protein YfhO